MRSNVYCGNLLWQLSLTLFFPESRMRENCTYGLTRGRTYPSKGRSALLYTLFSPRSRFGKWKYLHYGPSKKSVLKVCAKIKEKTLSRMKPVTNEEMVKRLSKMLRGWGNYFRCGYPSSAYNHVNWYAKERMYIRARRRSQRGYKLKYASTFRGELAAMGMYQLKWRRN